MKLLVENVKQSWRWFSMQAMTLAGVLQGAWISIPEDLRLSIPSSIIHWITILLLVAGIVGRLVKQKA